MLYLELFYQLIKTCYGKGWFLPLRFVAASIKSNDSYDHVHNKLFWCMYPSQTHSHIILQNQNTEVFLVFMNKVYYSIMTDNLSLANGRFAKLNIQCTLLCVAWI